jgi:hypothetical protein
MTAEDKEIRYGPIVATVSSKSQPDKSYEVRSKSGILSCNCKGWIFNKENPKRCRHTDAVSCGTRGLGSLENTNRYARQAESRKVAQAKRAGVGITKDKAALIVEELLAVGGIAKALPGTLARMAGVLRPYLYAASTQQVAAVPIVPTNDLLQVRPRCIILDD